MKKPFNPMFFTEPYQILILEIFVGIPNDFRLDFVDRMKMKNLRLIVKVICEKNDKGCTILGES